MGLDFESKGLKKLAMDVLQGIIVEELLTDVDIIQERQDICGSCERMDWKNKKCLECGCFLELKTKSKVNRKVNGGSEITHCPLNKWLDHFSKLGYDTSKIKQEQPQ